jgi:HEAT repeat protein
MKNQKRKVRVAGWMVWLRLGLALCGLSLTVPAARADEPLDSVMLRSPELPTPKVVLTFPEKLSALWLEALDRPEANLRCQAAQSIGRAHQQGMTGLRVAIPALTRELDRAGQHSSTRAAAAWALVALDARDAAPALFKLVLSGDAELREVVEPALARWGYAPAREEWLKRLSQPTPQRSVVLALRGLTAAREEKAAPRLRELVLSAETAPAVRLEAARALGVLRTTGAESDAQRLAADQSPRGVVGRVAGAWLLRQHGGGEAVRRLQSFARDTEPSVAAVALARLVEIDPAHVEPVLDTVLASPDANVRGYGVDVLFRRPSEKHLSLLGARLADKHPDVRAQARRALRERAADFRATVIREGERALAGADWRGREQAAILFAHLDHKPAADRLVDALNDTRPEVAVAAAWALRVLAVPATFPKVLEHFRTHTRGGDPPEWRDRQLTHLAQLLGQGRYLPADAALRALIPLKVPAGIQTRAAACWALGLLHEAKPLPEVAGSLAGRLAAISPFDLEYELVRRMCAVSLGRMKAKEQLPTLRKFYTDGKPSFNAVNNACGWAIEQVTGEKVPPPGVFEEPQRMWFLAPVD